MSEIMFMKTISTTTSPDSLWFISLTLFWLQPRRLDSITPSSAAAVTPWLILDLTLLLLGAYHNEEEIQTVLRKVNLVRPVSFRFICLSCKLRRRANGGYEKLMMHYNKFIILGIGAAEVDDSKSNGPSVLSWESWGTCTGWIWPGILVKLFGFSS